MIEESSSTRIFELLTRDQWDVWCGFAFERFCLKQAHRIAQALGFADNVLQASPYFQRGDKAFQIDLLYRRADHVITLCEIKYQESVSSKVIAEVERKVKLFQVPKGYTLEKALICLGGVETSLKESEYFHHILPIETIFKI